MIPDVAMLCRCGISGPADATVDQLSTLPSRPRTNSDGAEWPCAVCGGQVRIFFQPSLQGAPCAN